MKRFCIILILLSIVYKSIGQSDSLQIVKRKKIIVGSTSLGLSAATIGGLYYAWYKDYSSGAFHFFDDSREWLQMDKAGHFYSTFHVGVGAHGLMRWAGFKEKKAIWIGGMYGSMYMTAIEVMDGFSQGWGFSGTDFAANVGGSLLFCAQQQVWKESRIIPKFSFHATKYAAYRPEILGENYATRWLKDYNGQSYWLSVSPFTFMNKEKKFPRWLCLSLGYGADGMVSGEDNYVIVLSDGTMLGNNRARKFLLSLDIDFTKIPTKRKWLKTIFTTLNTMKFPMPTLEWKNNVCRVHGLYF